MRGGLVVPDGLRTSDSARRGHDVQFAPFTVSPSRGMSRQRRLDHSLAVTNYWTPCYVPALCHDAEHHGVYP